MKISYVMIVLNGMPFIEASLKSIYDSAYEIIIVEGAVKQCMFAANPDGSSKDGTVEFIKAFPDPKKKIKLIQGIWPEKCEMQNKAVKIATGDYIWLVDSDEVYKKKDIEVIIGMLDADPTITQINFSLFHFWKGFEYVLSSPILKSHPGFFRVFKLDKPCYFTTHRPPTFLLQRYKKTTYQMNRVENSVMVKKGIFIYHYSYVSDSQVKQKVELYKKYGWDKFWKMDLDDWFNNCYLKWTVANRETVEAKYPVWTGDKRSRTELFLGVHPDSILERSWKI